MKKILLLLVLFFCGLVMAGCVRSRKTLDDISKFYDNIEDVSDEKEAFYNKVTSKITNEVEKDTFTSDYFMVSTADVVASLYYGIINLHAITPKLVSAEVTKEKDVYIIKDGDNIARVKFDNKTVATSLEFYEKDVLTYVIETIKVKNNQYAYQLIIRNDTNDYTVIQFLFDENNGRISVNTNSVNKPDPIYNNLKVINSKFASEGIRVYKIENGNYQFVGELIGPIDETKKVTDFTIDSGLKLEYMLGEEFDITKLKIKVTYEDNNTAIVSVAQSMIVGNLPNTSTLGTITLKLSYKNIEKNFTYLVVEGDTSRETIMYNSYKGFYNSLAFGSNSFIMQNTGNNALKANDKKDAFGFFTKEITSTVLGQWSHFNLLNESIEAIKAHQEGKLGISVFPDPTNQYNKYAFCNYDANDNVYRVGYWAGKQLNILYWFESTISYDIESDSLKVDIYAGIGENKLYRAHIEYQKLGDSYAAFVYYPQDENKDQGKYNSMHFFFNGIEGRVVENRWVDPINNTIYMKTISDEYAKVGDKVLSITNNGSTITYTDSLISDAINLLHSFIYNNSEYENSVEDIYFKKIKSKDTDDNFYPDEFTLNEYIIYLVMSFKEIYDKKLFTFEVDEKIVKVEAVNDSTKFIIAEGTDEEEIYIIKYITNNLSIEYITNEVYIRAELVKQDSVYYIQVINKDSIEYPSGKQTYRYIQCKYTDINNITLAVFMNRYKVVDGIYNNIPETFTRNSDVLYSLIDNVYAFKESIRVDFCPGNDEENYWLMTDLDGYITLPTINFSKTSAWYDDFDEKIGNQGQKVRITSPVTLYAS